MGSEVKASHDDFAKTYDEASKQVESHAHEILFGLAYEFIHPQETLLDLGVGTGLASFLFHKAGLIVYGIDQSAQMLEVCREKGFAKELKTCDLSQGNWPYADKQFNHAISGGVFHFISDLNVFFSETNRVLQDHGTFSFTTLDKTGEETSFVHESGIRIYLYNENDIRAQAKKHGFELLKSVSFYAFKTPAKKEKLLFKAYTLKKLPGLYAKP